MAERESKSMTKLHLLFKQGRQREHKANPLANFELIHDNVTNKAHGRDNIRQSGMITSSGITSFAC
eukprot:scaffold8241_cov148-Skeletonema_dohrnii-CCMP3373.AAC.1